MTDDETIPLGGRPPADDPGRSGETAPAGGTGSTLDAGPTGDSASGGSPSGGTGSSADPADPARRRRRLIRFGVAGAAVLILLVCAGVGAVAAGVNRLAHNADQARENRSRVDTGCVDLERRLNRLAPPGAAANPTRRAAAIRAENVALGPFLSELDDGQRHGLRADGPGRDRPGKDRSSLAAAWHQLVDARTGYADALDRQAAGREPAFFVPPKDRLGRPLFDRLDGSPRSCDGVARRLTAPDL